MIATVRSTEYIYRKADGATAYKIVRSDLENGSKTFGQWHYDSKKWKPGITGIPRVPYMLPEVLSVIARGGLVIKVEGEKCADRLNKEIKAYPGLVAVATCNNGGAGNWTDEQSVYLKDARVCILPDNDTAGERDVITVCKRLKGLAKSIKVVRLPGLGPKDDIYDWLEMGRTMAELRKLYHDTSEYEHPVEAQLAPRPPVVAREGVTGLAKWAQAALVGCADELAKMTSQRNNMLFTKACRLANISAHGLLEETECRSVLEAACYSNGYLPEHPYRSFEATFDSGWNRGKKTPCELPKPHQVDQPKVKANVKLQSWAKGLPVIVRGLLNAYVYPSTGPVLELIIEAINKELIGPDEWIDCNRMSEIGKELGRNLSKSTIERGLKQGANSLSVEFIAVLLIQSGPPGDEELMGKTAENPLSGGRPATKYKLMPIPTILDNLLDFVMAPLIRKAFPSESPLVAPIRAEFIQGLDRPEAELIAETLKSEYSEMIESQEGYAEAMAQVHKEHAKIASMIRNPEHAPLPVGTYKNAGEYMALCARAIIIARGGKTQMKREDWALLIGCSVSSVNTILKRGGIEVLKDQYADKEVMSIIPIKAARGWDKEMAGFAEWVVSDKTSGAMSMKNRTLIRWCEGELAKGATLTIRYAQPNKQRLKIEQPIEPEAKPKAPAKPRMPSIEPRAPRKTLESIEREWIEHNEVKAVIVVAKAQNVPIKTRGRQIRNEQTGEIQLPLDFLLGQTSSLEALDATTPEAIDHNDTEAIVAELVALGGTVSAVHEAGSAEYAKLAS